MAISPHIAVTTLIDELRERLRDVEKTRTDLISSLQRCVSHTSQVDNRDQGFNVIIGYANAIARIRQMILDAKKEYVSIFSRYGLARLAQKDDSLRTAIGLANRRNVAIRVISEADESNIVGVNFLSGKAGFRSSHDIRFYVDIVDKREMVFGPVMGESMQNHREADLWTTNRDFISSMYALFEELWKTSKRTARSDFRQS
jgi:sugar-specific transcriptional regulator TrmB